MNTLFGVVPRPIVERIEQPTPEAIRAARQTAGLTQAQAAQLVSRASKAGYKTWGAYELAAENPNHRSIPLASWELFLILTGQHPTIRAYADPSARSPHIDALRRPYPSAPST